MYITIFPWFCHGFAMVFPSSQLLGPLDPMVTAIFFRWALEKQTDSRRFVLEGYTLW